MRILKWYAPTDQQEITDIALHYVFEAEPGAKEYTIFASENPDFVKAETVHVLQKMSVIMYIICLKMMNCLKLEMVCKGSVRSRNINRNHSYLHK